MAEDKVKKPEKDLSEIGLVKLTQDSGVGIQMPDGEVIDLSNLDLGMSQVLAYLVKSISDLKKNLV